MGIHSGKFYDAKKMQEYCDIYKDIASNYNGKADLIHADFSSFHTSDGFMGRTADEAKQFIKNGMGNMTKAVTTIHDQMVKAQTELITMFEEMVDPAQNARIEYDTLEKINNDFKDLYLIYKERAKNVKKLVDGLNEEFGNYAYFEQPDSQTAMNAFIELCGGEDESKGYLKSCQNKLLAFDEAAKSMLNSKRKIIKSEKVNSCIANATSTLTASTIDTKTIFNITPLTPIIPIIDYKKLAEVIASGAEALANYLTRLKDAIEKMPEKKFFEFIDSLDIPHTWPNEDIILFYELSQMNISQEHTEANAAHNTENLTSSILKPGYIENQAQWGDINYGKSDMAYSGCEIIATYNAIYDLTGRGGADEMVELISHFEQNGSSVYGGLGTSPKAVEEYLQNQGFNTSMTCKTDSESIKEIQDDYDTYIVTAYNDENHLSAEIHTVSITEEDGKYTIHNDYYSPQQGAYINKGQYNSLEEAIEAINTDSKMISLIGVSEPLTGDFPESEEHCA